MSPQFLEAILPDRTGRQQYSFSRLSGGLALAGLAVPTGDDESSEGPATLDPLGLGTLVHAVLAEADFARAESPALVRRHALRHLPEAGAELAEPIAWIQRFSTSRRGEAIAAAEEVHRESSSFWLGRPIVPTRKGRICKDSSIVSIATRRTAGG